ncbi:glycosyltransferase family 39 protein [Edaphobacter flagellatus]|uniref:glycosyltransferase family 39 protein n=1 Tax=Edaphobacter flagellatus TaxID=1933044 RepID=UPI0021B2C7C2|nr:glycosyltransferase family 39 protein [Edaphobacter flagellatus]
MRLLSALRQKLYLLGFIAIFLSAWCKLSILNSRELWLDETYSAYVANLPFHHLLRFTTGDVHPQLFSIVLWGWVHLVGDAQVRLRLFSALVNICCMLAMFFLAQRVLGARWGSFASALFAFSPMLLVYSLEVRSYMLFMFAFVCALIIHWRVVIEEDDRKGLLLAYSLLLALLFYIHYLGVFFVAGLFIHWVLRKNHIRAKISSILTVGILTLLFVSPGIPLLLSQHALKVQLNRQLERSHSDPQALSFGSTGVDPNESHGIGAMARNTAVMAGFYPATSHTILLICAIPLTCALAGVVLLGLFKGDEICRLFLILSILLYGAVVAFHLGSTRYLLFLIPVLVLAMARTLQFSTTSLKWSQLGAVMGVVLLATYCAGFIRQATRPHGRPWENVVRAIQTDYQPGDKVIFDALYSQVPFDYFASHRNFHPVEAGFPIDIYTWWDMQRHTGWGGPVITQSDLNNFTSDLLPSDGKTIWLVSYETYYYDPNNALLKRLSELGHSTLVPLPENPDDHAGSNDSQLRLYRIAR